MGNEFREFVEEFVRPFALIFGFIAVVLLVFSIFAASVDALDCYGFEAGTGTQTKWRFGCYANVNGQWVPTKYVFGDAHELRVKK